MIAPILSPNIDRPDDFYAALVALTAGHSDTEALARQARLILLLANQIGDVAILSELIRLAGKDVASDRQGEGWQASAG